MLRSGILDTGEDSAEWFGEVAGVTTLGVEESEALLPEVMLPTLELVDERLRLMSGALYESMLVVERSSTGWEIFCWRMVSECLVVRLLLGIGVGASAAAPLGRRLVKARDSEDDMAIELMEEEEEVGGAAKMISSRVCTEVTVVEGQMGDLLERLQRSAQFQSTGRCRPVRARGGVAGSGTERRSVV